MVNERRNMVGPAIGLCLLLAACAGKPSGPVAWWHDYEGGVIAQDRPPPPGESDPYPNFAQLPANPKTLPAAQRQRQISELDETRNLSLASAAATPLPVEDQAAKPAAKTPASAAAAPATLSSVAATAKPAAPAAFVPTPMPAVADIDHPPALAADAPPLAQLADVGGTLLTPIAPQNPNLLVIGFDEGSELVPREAQPGLIAFAQAHPGRVITITGSAGATASDAALAQGWRRAKAVAAQLEAAGVPADRVRLAAKAPGGGAELSLTN